VRDRRAAGFAAELDERRDGEDAREQTPDAQQNDVQGGVVVGEHDLEAQHDEQGLRAEAHPGLHGSAPRGGFHGVRHMRNSSGGRAGSHADVTQTGMRRDAPRCPPS
jgi:hypothetical protein